MITDFFDDVGDGAPIVLVHGFVSTRRVFGYQLTDLSRDRRVIAIDLPGFGRTSWEPRRPWFEQAVERVVSVVEHTGVENPLIVGWSLGGSVVTAAASSIPGSTTMLVGSRLGRRSDEMRARILASIERDFPSYVNKLVALMCHSVSPQTHSWLLGLAMETPILVAASALMSQPPLDPVRIVASVVGGHEGVVEVDHVAQEVRDVTIVFDESGHLPFIEEKARFNALLRSLTGSAG